MIASMKLDLASRSLHGNLRALFCPPCYISSTFA
jgi:hypothetical protein